jgi:tripartite-type tricarboxylate transporter receptor subunit TctC
MAKRARRGVLALSALLAIRGAAAQDAARPVRLIVPYAPGGTNDINARLLADPLARALGQPVLVENRGGGATIPGMQAVAQAAPDGLTLGVADSAFTINPALLGAARLPYDTRRDFAPVSLLVSAPLVVVVAQSLPADDLQGLAALARARPGTLSYSSAGIGTSGHLAGEQFKQAAGGLDILHVPHRGAGPAVTDLLGGQVQITFGSLPLVQEHLRAGRLRALAVTGAQRAPLLPGVPSATEAGLPELDTELPVGLVLPGAAAPETVQRLALAAAGVVTAPGPFHERLTGMGFRPIGSSPAEFAARIDAEITRWAAVIRRGNIQPE